MFSIVAYQSGVDYIISLCLSLSLNMTAVDKSTRLILPIKHKSLPYITMYFIQCIKDIMLTVFTLY